MNAIFQSPMIGSRRLRLLAGAALLLAVAPATPQAPQRPAPPSRGAPPKLEPVAETRLIMEGLAQSNFRGAERLLRQKPADAETWAFLRGQALLLGETGNLLLMRPPKNAGESAWMERATDLRTAATRLARTAGESDFERSRAAFVELAAACNRCHERFRVPTKVTPFAEPPERKVAAGLDGD
jgi:cytochrome c553